jgi:predicted ArsR family transcriptional regulator
VAPAWVCGREIGNIVVVKSATIADTSAHTRPTAGHDDARTRDRVARALHEHGPQSAVALSALFGLTPTAVRRHLDALISAGRVSEVAERKVRGQLRGRGRPARLFALTDDGHASFGHAYDGIAVAALNYLKETGGPEAVASFAHQRVAGVEARYAAALVETAADRRPAELAEILTADGYAASAHEAGAGMQVCQHHCPIAHVAADFPQLCEAETEMFGRLLGTHVQRLATIAHGDGICTTHIPASKPSPDHSSRQTTSGEVIA